MARHLERIAKLLKILSARRRLRIVQLLKDRALCVNALALRLGVTPGAVSQHLRVMRDAGLVIDEKRGYFVHYRLNEKTLAMCRSALADLLAPTRASRRCTKGAKPCAALVKRRAAESRKT